MNPQERRRWVYAAVAALIGMNLVACGGSELAAEHPARQMPNTAVTAAASEATARSNEAWKPSIRTASLPADPCGWIPAAEVEELMGTLAEPPRKDDDGCRYTLVMPESVKAKRQQANAARETMREKFRQAFGSSAEAEQPNPILDTESDPRTYAVTIRVDVSGKGAKEAEKGETAPPAAGWDEARPHAYRFTGRTGHIWITAAGAAPDVPREPIPVLAARVRDRIPDLPFPVTNPYQVIQSGTNDPCSLLTRAEAEAVLGPLAIEPYRSSSEWPPFAHGQGSACAYFSPGHRVFVLSPTWDGGAQSYKIAQGIGGLISIVAPQELVVMKGPWEQASSGLSGELLFLKGDRLLEVYYRTSRATRGDAVKLAATAMQRLGS
jgi:hypothetical protein